MPRVFISVQLSIHRLAVYGPSLQRHRGQTRTSVCSPWPWPRRGRKVTPTSPKGLRLTGEVVRDANGSARKFRATADLKTHWKHLSNTGSFRGWSLTATRRPVEFSRDRVIAGMPLSSRMPTTSSQAQSSIFSFSSPSGLILVEVEERQRNREAETETERRSTIKWEKERERERSPLSLFFSLSFKWHNRIFFFPKVVLGIHLSRNEL